MTSANEVKFCFLVTKTSYLFRHVPASSVLAGFFLLRLTLSFFCTCLTASIPVAPQGLLQKSQTYKNNVNLCESSEQQTSCFSDTQSVQVFVNRKLIAQYNNGDPEADRSDKKKLNEQNNCYFTSYCSL